MSPHARRASPHRRPRRLILEPLEDRLLLSAPAAAPGWGDGQNRAAAAAVKPPSDTTPDTDTYGGSAWHDRSGSAGALMGPQPPAQLASSHPAAVTAAASPSGTAATAQAEQARYPASSAMTNAYPQGDLERYPASSPESGKQKYSAAAAGESNADYYPPAHTLTSAGAAARAAEPSLTAVPGVASPGSPPPSPVRPAGNAAAPVAAAGAPQATAAGSPQGVGGQSDPARPEVPVPEETAAEARPYAFPIESVARADASPASTVWQPEAVPLFPLALPLPGGLLAADLSAWERGVRELFRRLDALGSETGEEASWGRLAPWCAALGAMTVALELARRRLGKRWPADPTEVRGRGLAWSWSHDPQGNDPPEQP